MIETAISFWADIKRYEDMLEADPRSYCFAPLSDLYRKLGLLDDAISVAKKGCSVHPDYAGGYLALANALLAKGENEEAREALERVVATNPENVKAQKLLSQIYADAGETERAREALRRVLVDNPDDTESVLLMRTISGSAPGGGTPEEALEEVELLEELEEELPEPELFEAEELFELEEEPLPEEPALQAAPAHAAPAPEKDPLTTATMAELYVSQGFPEKALRIYRALLEDHPGHRGYSERVGELERLAAGAPEVEPFAAAEEETLVAVGAFEEEAPVAAGPGDPQDERLEILEKWLENIKRRKAHAL